VARVGRSSWALRADQGFLTVFLGVLMIGLWICTMTTWVWLFLKMYRRVVSVGVMLLCVNLLSLSFLDEHFAAIFLDLLVIDELHGDLLRLGGLVLLHGDILRHSVLVLGVLRGSEGGASSVLPSTTSSSDLSLDGTLANFFLDTFTSIFLDSACVFLVAAARAAFLAAAARAAFPTASSLSNLSSTQVSLYFTSECITK
jgi:hypothetical protein